MNESVAHCDTIASPGITVTFQSDQGKKNLLFLLKNFVYYTIKYLYAL